MHGNSPNIGLNIVVTNCYYLPPMWIRLCFHRVGLSVCLSLCLSVCLPVCLFWLTFEGVELGLSLKAILIIATGFIQQPGPCVLQFAFIANLNILYQNNLGCFSMIVNLKLAANKPSYQFNIYGKSTYSYNYTGVKFGLWN